MSVLLVIFMGVLAIAGMVNNADWRYWMSAWAICALFLIASNISNLVNELKEIKRGIS